MDRAVDRLRKVVTYSECEAIKAIHDEIVKEDKNIVIAKNVADAKGITRSVVVNGMKLLEVAGILETRSMGMKGTYIKILDREAFKKVSEF